MNKGKVTVYDEEYPALSSTVPFKKTPAGGGSALLITKNTGTTELQNVWKEFEAFQLESTDSFGSEKLSSKDFTYALCNSKEIIPELSQSSASHSPIGKPSEAAEKCGYPTTPNLLLMQPEFFSKYDNQTLFFIFFNFVGSIQQWFASRELIKRKWQFNTFHKTWFRLIGEPIEETEESITGKYEYLDYSSSGSWSIRTKHNFTFERNHLEK